MAKINFEQINSGNDGGNFTVGFFSLKNDGDEAVVRIMHDDISSFDLVTTHPIQIGNKYRRVNCIRDPRDPMDNCPLCKSGAKVQQRFYIHLIQYVKDEKGNIIPQAKIWERSASYAVTIKNLIDEYGPLSDCIFKIRRNGEAGSMNTTYSILFGNPQVYRPEFYPKDNSLFEGYSVVGSAVMDKNFDEIAEFIATGEFPQRNNDENTNNIPTSMNSNINNYTVPHDPNGVVTQTHFVDDNGVSAPYATTASNATYPNRTVPTPVRDTMVNPNTHQFNDDNVTAPQRPVRFY